MTDPRTCQGDVWDGSYRMVCGRVLVDGKCQLHGVLVDPRTPTSDPVAEPQTKAGRNLMVEVGAAAHRGGGITVARTKDDILAIEAEARQQARAAFAAQVAWSERDVLRGTQDPAAWGVPEDYAAGYIAGVRLLRDALAASTEPVSPEAPGSGLDVERLARALASWATQSDPDSDDRRKAQGIAAEYAARPDGGTDPVPGLVAGVPQREPVGDVPGQGAVTEPVPADLCGAVMATCRNEPGHDGEHWHPGVLP